MQGDFSPPARRRPERPKPLPLDGRPAPFCPRCRGDGPADGQLCRECGEPLRPRGYCPTCEATWNRPVGTPCPKHDVPLADAPLPAAPPEGAGPRAEAWVTVATYGHPNEANAARIRLEAEGIMTFLDGERVAGSTLLQVATGGARLQVPGSLAAAARVLLAQTWSARLDPETDLDPPDEDDPWAGLAPEPGARRRAAMKLAILAFLFGPALLTLLTLCARALGWSP